MPATSSKRRKIGETVEAPLAKMGLKQRDPTVNRNRDFPLAVVAHHPQIRHLSEQVIPPRHQYVVRGNFFEAIFDVYVPMNETPDLIEKGGIRSAFSVAVCA